MSEETVGDHTSPEPTPEMYNLIVFNEAGDFEGVVENLTYEQAEKGKEKVNANRPDALCFIESDGEMRTDILGNAFGYARGESMVLPSEGLYE